MHAKKIPIKETVSEDAGIISESTSMNKTIASKSVTPYDILSPAKIGIFVQFLIQHELFKFLEKADNL